MTNSFDTLLVSIADTSHYFQQQAQKQVNVALTLRNWLIGAYLVEYEQQGEDRAQYGEKLYQNWRLPCYKTKHKRLDLSRTYIC
jgi:hypothetical protein